MLREPTEHRPSLVSDLTVNKASTSRKGQGMRHDVLFSFLEVSLSLSMTMTLDRSIGARSRNVIPGHTHTSADTRTSNAVTKAGPISVHLNPARCCCCSFIVLILPVVQYGASKLTDLMPTCCLLPAADKIFHAW